ncbi:MAG TPA: DUF86 domain-containing protein [Nitrospiraceae bacterium]|nr:DUF86 domain-containing protein [Nitrospiraceae bacterium]
MTPVDPAVLRRKLAVIIDNLRTLEQVVTMPLDRYRREVFTRKGTERLLQEAIEAAFDINTHLIVHSGATVPDEYYQGFLKLADLGILSADLAAELAPSAGLRNRLVHEYDAIVDTIVLDAVRKAQKLFPQYVKAVETYLERTEGESLL